MHARTTYCVVRNATTRYRHDQASQRHGYPATRAACALYTREKPHHRHGNNLWTAQRRHCYGHCRAASEYSPPPQWRRWNAHCFPAVRRRQSTDQPTALAMPQYHVTQVVATPSRLLPQHLKRGREYAANSKLNRIQFYSRGFPDNLPPPPCWHPPMCSFD